MGKNYGSYPGTVWLEESNSEKSDSRLFQLIGRDSDEEGDRQTQRIRKNIIQLMEGYCNKSENPLLKLHPFHGDKRAHQSDARAICKLLILNADYGQNGPKYTYNILEMVYQHAERLRKKGVDPKDSILERLDYFLKKELTSLKGESSVKYQLGRLGELFPEYQQMQSLKKAKKKVEEEAKGHQPSASNEANDRSSLTPLKRRGSKSA